MAHLLVEWLNEGNLRQFSVVPVLSLCDGELRTKGKELVGKAASFQWKKSECVGKVIQAGTQYIFGKIIKNLETFTDCFGQEIKWN